MFLYLIYFYINFYINFYIFILYYYNNYLLFEKIIYIAPYRYILKIMQQYHKHIKILKMFLYILCYVKMS